ncbi:hypothetical protein EXA18_00610 [Vibrio cincinnatiensis]|uniref:hypothetical protein n=1 Tax=Vibrio cincinnatiensis TaxID=675 RepID=UPI001EE084F2|nr:hypothetical protein [Vibrio cincinnatiensis]MCG3741984.1 hypothetical protein [Vibrio cincinnatiensis]
MTNTLVINWNKLPTFTAIPIEISSICKYNNKKLSMDHKVIYSYLAKLDADNKLNNSGHASFDNIMQRFGYGSKGSLTGYIQHLVDVGLIVKSETRKGQRNIYTVNPINLDLVSYGSKSHVADSNKNKREAQKNEAPKKPNNFMFAKHHRSLLQTDPTKLKQFNKWYMREDKLGVELGSKDYERFLVECGYIKHEQTQQFEPQPNFEDMQPCDGTESYFTDHPPVECYQFAPVEPEDYNDELDANYGFIEDINTTAKESCPTYYMCSAELASYEQCVIINEETEEREEAAVYSFIMSCDDKPEPLQNSVEVVKHIAQVDSKEIVEVELPKQEVIVKGNKSKLLQCFRPITDISEIDVNDYGVGYFASPIAKQSCDKDTARQYLKVLHSHFWGQYNPDEQTVDSIVNWLNLPEERNEFLDSIGCYYSDEGWKSVI